MGFDASHLREVTRASKRVRFDASHLREATTGGRGGISNPTAAVAAAAAVRMQQTFWQYSIVASS